MRCYLNHMSTYGRKFVIAPEWYQGKRYRGRYALEYRVIAEKLLGRALKDTEVVHHKDGNKKNNDPQNLEVLERRVHTRLHQEHRLARLVEIQCPTCAKLFVRRWHQSNANQKRQKLTFCSRPCMGRFWNTKDRTKFVENKIVREFFGKLTLGLHNGSAQGFEPCGGGSIPSPSAT